MVIYNQTKIELIAIRVVEAIYEEENKSPKAGKFLYRKKVSQKTTVEELKLLKSYLSKKYNTPLLFVHCDFEIIESKHDPPELF